MMTLDMIIAGRRPEFGQPEINIGVIRRGRDAGADARLGKAGAMDMVLTGQPITPRSARAGLISGRTQAEHTSSRIPGGGHEVGTKSPLAIRLAKEAVIAAYETPLSEGLEYERKLFYLLFATEDQKEGMAASLEKRDPDFKGR